MKTIKYCDEQRTLNLSDKVYVILNDEHPSPNYKTGAKVRLISGIDDSPVPGYHYKSWFVTVCRDDAPYAEFCGVRKTNLELVP